MGFFSKMADPSGLLGINDDGLLSKDNLFGKEGGIKQISTLSPRQEAVATPLSDYLKSRVGQGLQSYDGQMVAGLSPYEQTGLNRLAGYLGQDRPATLDAASGALMRALSGDPAYDINPAITEQYIQDNVYAPARREFDTRTLPALQEQYAGSPSNFYTSERRQAEQRARGDLENQLSAQASNLRYQDELARRQALTDAANRTGTVLGYAPGITSADEGFGLRQAAASQQYGALPRLLEQQAFDAQLQEFLRTQPELSPVIQQALQYIGTPTTENIIQPGTPGLIGPLMGAVGTIGGAMIGGPAGAAVGSQLGQAFSSTPNTPVAVSGNRAGYGRQSPHAPTNGYSQLY